LLGKRLHLVVESGLNTHFGSLLSLASLDCLWELRDEIITFAPLVVATLSDG
jgi:hypothetical protein